MKHDPSRRAALRATTADAHAALDAAVGEIAAPADLARYLRGIHAFRAAVEPQVAASPWPTPPLAALIEADMAALAVPRRPPVAIAPLARDSASQFGLAYVLEGSAVGARLIAAQVRRLGLEARHLTAQTADPARWRAFCVALEAAEDYDPDAAARAAHAAFDAAARAFAEPPHG